MMMTCSLDHGDDVEGNLGGASHRIMSSRLHEMPVERGLHCEVAFGRRGAVVAPAVHQHGLQVLVACQALHQLEGAYRVLWPEDVGHVLQNS